MPRWLHSKYWKDRREPLGAADEPDNILTNPQTLTSFSSTSTTSTSGVGGKVTDDQTTLFTTPGETLSERLKSAHADLLVAAETLRKTLDERRTTPDEDLAEIYLNIERKDAPPPLPFSVVARTAQIRQDTRSKTLASQTGNFLAVLYPALKWTLGLTGSVAGTAGFMPLQVTANGLGQVLELLMAPRAKNDDVMDGLDELTRDEKFILAIRRLPTAHLDEDFRADVVELLTAMNVFLNDSIRYLDDNFLLKAVRGVAVVENVDKSKGRLTKARNRLGKAVERMAQFMIISKGLEAEDEKILNCICPADFVTPHFDKQGDLHRRRLPASATWFMADPKFVLWRDAQLATLYCPGLPGAGKTFTSSAVIDHVDQLFKERNVGLAFVFFEHSSMKNKAFQEKSEAVLRSIVRQLLRRETSFCSRFEDALDNRYFDAASAEDAIIRLCDCFDAVAIVIDALDEFSTKHSESLDLIDILVKLRDRVKVPKFKLLLTSRDMPHVRERLKPDGELPIRADPIDVQAMIKREYKSSDFADDPDLEREIVTEITKRSDCIFKLAELQVKSTLSPAFVNAAQVSKHLRSLYTRVDDYYADDLEQIREAREMAPKVLKMLAWLCTTQQPLHVDELSIALTIDENSDDPIDNSALGIKNFHRFIAAARGLVGTRKTRVRAQGGWVSGECDHERIQVTLSHETVASFLHRKLESLHANAQTLISSTCLKFMSSEPWLKLLLKRRHEGFDYVCAREDDLLEITDGLGIDRSLILREGTKKIFKEERSVSVLYANEDFIEVVTIAEWECSEAVHFFRFAFHGERYLPRTLDRQMQDRLKSLCDAAALDMQTQERSTPADSQKEGLTWMFEWLSKCEWVPGCKWLLDQGLIQIIGNYSSYEEYGWTLWPAPFHILPDHGDRRLHHEYPEAIQQWLAVYLFRAWTTRDMMDLPVPQNDIYQMLYVSCQEGWIECVAEMLDILQSCKVQTDFWEFTRGHGFGYHNLLSTALSKGHFRIAELLLERDDDISAPKGPFDNVFSEAVTQGALETVKLLNKKSHLSKQERYDYLLTAVAVGSIEIIKLLLDGDADINTLEGKHGTALQLASCKGQSKVVKLLLKRHADINMQGGKYGNALQAASRKGQSKVVKLLISNGAAINALGGKYGTALQAASRSGQVEIIGFLIDNGADINLSGGKYGSALQAAASQLYRDTDWGQSSDISSTSRHSRYGAPSLSRDYTQSVKLLVDRGADVNMQGGMYGSALQAASFRGHGVEFLLENGADVNAQGGKYGTALQAAASEGRVEIVRLLIEHGADLDMVGGKYGSALYGALQCWQNLDTTKLLLNKGANIHVQAFQPESVLYLASCKDDVELVKLILDKGAEVNTRGGQYGNPLQAAIRHRATEVAKLLLENGADVNAQGGEYGNALQIAMRNQEIEIVELLLEQGANVDALGGEHHSALLVASCDGYIEGVQTLLNKGVNLNINFQESHYGNALQAAISHLGENQYDSERFGSRKKIVELLLDNGADVNLQGGYYGNALQAAAFGGHTEIIKLLLEKGAEVNARGGFYNNALQAVVSKRSNEALSDAASYKSDGQASGTSVDDVDIAPSVPEGDEPKTVQFGSNGDDTRSAVSLSDGGDSSTASSKSEEDGSKTASSRADGNGQDTTLTKPDSRRLEIVGLLIEQGADIHAQGGYYGNALQVASATGNTEVIKLLLDKGVNVNEQGGHHNSALYAASFIGCVQGVKLLLDNGADVNMQGENGSALHAVTFEGCDNHVKVAEMLLDRNANVNLQDEHLGDALQAASLRENIWLVELFLERGADANAQGGDHGNALQAAACSNDRGLGLEIVELLLAKGADINMQGGSYGTALQAASLWGELDVVKLLLARGANVDLRCGRYGSALQAAASPSDSERKNHYNVVNVLLKKGANVNAQGGYFGTALQAACVVGDKNVVRLLIQNGANINATPTEDEEEGHYGTALQAAARFCSVDSEIVGLLLDAGANVNAQGGYFGTALQAAASTQYRTEIVAQLLSRGADVNIQGGHHGNALHAALSAGGGGGGGSRETVELLLDHGAHVNAAETCGEEGHALQIAILNVRSWDDEQKNETVKMLLDRGADVNARGGLHGCALQAAAYTGNAEVVQLLLERGAEIDATGGCGGSTALGAARGEGHFHVVRMLVERGAV